MQTEGRALYNLLRMRWEEDPTIDVEPWQVENLRTLETNELFNRLSQFGISLDETSFAQYKDTCDSPEQLTEMLWIKEELDHFDQGYLLIFELWRRLSPEKPSLSIFCDELDHLIDLYDAEKLDNHDLLHDYLDELERILDENVDQGSDPHEVFEQITRYCAHDLESFIYDFASDEIDHGHELYASELIEGFSLYIPDKIWLNFLNLRLLSQTNPEEVENMFSRFLERVKENPDFELLLEIARYLVNRGAVSDFVETVELALPLIQTEQDLQEILSITSEFCRLLEQEEEVETIASILKERSEIPLETPVSYDDPILSRALTLFKNLNRSEA